MTSLIAHTKLTFRVVSAREYLASVLFLCAKRWLVLVLVGLGLGLGLGLRFRVRVKV